jgi:hypothetical protein
MGFFEDDAWQREVRNHILAPGFYKKYATDGRYVFIDKGSLVTTLQKSCAVDTVLQGGDGRAISIEEKIVRWKGKTYDKFFLETISDTRIGRERPGWMAYGKSDYLLYCFMQEDGKTLVSYLIDFPKLVDWFWQRVKETPCPYSSFRMPWNNETEGILVPIVDVEKNVPTWKFTITEQG